MMKKINLSFVILCLVLLTSPLGAQDQLKPVENPWKMPIMTDGKKVYLALDQTSPELIKGLDARTVEPVIHSGKGIYLKDKSRVYFFDGFGEFRFIKIKGADDKTFTPLPGYFSKDKKRAYYHQSPIYKADPGTFKPLILESAQKDPAFEHIGYAYSKDKRRVYFMDKEVLKADPNSFKLLGASKAKDRFYYFKDGKIESMHTCPDKDI